MDWLTLVGQLDDFPLTMLAVKAGASVSASVSHPARMRVGFFILGTFLKTEHRAEFRFYIYA